MSYSIAPIVEQGKFFVSFGAAIWAFFSAYMYVKQSLSETKEGISSLKSELNDQTHAIVTATNVQTAELRAMGNDVGRLVQAAMVYPAPARRAAKASRK